MVKNQAVVVQRSGEAKVQEISIPKLRDDYIIVKVKAVALNPTDWKHIDYVTTEGARVGSICTLIYSASTNMNRLVVITQALSKK
jgi:NADPH:quinone reductase-like Zn-dependent oxidoreductase